VGAGSLWPTKGGRLQEGQGDGSIRGGENIRVTNNEKYI